MKSIGYRDLKSVAILKDLDGESLHALFSIAKQKVYDTHDYIVMQDEKAETAFILIRGTAEVFRIGESGEKENIILMGPGDVIGLGDKPTFYKHWIRSANVVALEPMILYEFTIKEYLLLLKEHPQLMEAFNEIASRMGHYSFIQKLFPFAAFNYRKIRSIANLLEEKHVPKETMLIRQGDSSDTCYFLLKGQVEISHEIDHQKHVLKLLDAGEIIGESALLSGVKRTASVVTTKDSILLEARGEDLKKVVYDYPELSKFYLEIVRQRLRPKRLDNIEVSTIKDSGKEMSYTIKNPEKLTFYRLTDHGYFIWNLLDGKHTIDDLNEKFMDHFKVPSGEFVAQLVFNLTSQGFVENPAESLEKAVTDGDRFTGFTGYLKRLWRRITK